MVLEEIFKTILFIIIDGKYSIILKNTSNLFLEVWIFYDEKYTIFGIINRINVF